MTQRCLRFFLASAWSFVALLTFNSTNVSHAQGTSPEISPQKTIVVYGGGGASYMQQFEKQAGILLHELTDEDIWQNRFEAAKGDVLAMLGGGGCGGGQTFSPSLPDQPRGRGRRGGAVAERAVKGNTPTAGVGPRGGRGGNRVEAEQADKFLFEILKRQPDTKVVAVPQVIRGIKQRGSSLSDNHRLIVDTIVTEYLGRGRTSRENLRRALNYLAATYAGSEIAIELPAEIAITGFYHPELARFEPDLQEFLSLFHKKGIDTTNAPRVVILANHTHFVSRNQLAIDAILEELTRRKAIAACMIVENQKNRPLIKEFAPQVAIDAFHRGDDIEFRTELGIPHLYAMWLGRQTIEEWQQTVSHIGSYLGVESSEVNGSIEPTVVSGRSTDDPVDRFVPIPDRIDRIVSRALTWVKLSQKPNKQKRIAMLVSGAPGGDLNKMKSLEIVLKRMKQDGYEVQGDITSESLHEQIEQYVEQYSPLEQKEIDRLAKSGKAALVPVDDYRAWLDSKVPTLRRKELITKWGDVPGNIMVWSNGQGEQFLVIPKFELGNVSLVAKPIPWSENVENFEQHKRDLGSPPSHNILATYFWLEEHMQADALMVWGLLSFDTLAPGKSIGQSQGDWSDILLGSMPNVRPYSLGSLSFSLPAKRKAKAVLVDYLPPPSVAGKIDSELLNIQSDLLKWQCAREGPLKERFRKSISKDVYRLHIDQDLHWEGTGQSLINDEQLQELAGYLNQVDAERITLDRHVLGETPTQNLVIPHLVTCLGKSLIEELSAILPIPQEAQELLVNDQKFLRKQAEEIMRHLVFEEFSPEECLLACGADLESVSPELLNMLTEAQKLHASFQQCHLEVDRIMDAFSGRFVPPGPSSPPERNPASVPTGRNMYVMNPEEIPTRQSWELGKRLVDDLLARQLDEKDEYPQKIAFSIYTRGTITDFGVAEAQILYTLGVRPVWDRGNRVIDIELIPSEELKRPRIDVFVEPKHYYTEYLESRVRLIDKAVRMVAELDEPNNFVRANTRKTLDDFLSNGVDHNRADALSKARIFAVSPERFGSGLHDKLFEATGTWNTEEELTDVYIHQHDFVYTKGLWAERSPAGFRKQIDGTDIVMKTMTRRGALEGRAHYSGGILSLVTKVVSGKEPDYFLSDVRNIGEEKVLCARDAVRLDLRSKLYNDKWIEAQMKQGRGGAMKIASMIWHTVGYRINNSQVISDDVWQEIVDIYLRDRKNLNVNEWLETQHPGAFQEVMELLLETIRKGYWHPEESVISEIAAAYATSVSRDGLAGDENQKLEQFVRNALQGPGNIANAELISAYQAETKSTEMVHKDTALETSPEKITGNQLEKVASTEIIPSSESSNLVVWGILVAVLLVGAGYFHHNRSSHLS